MTDTSLSAFVSAIGKLARYLIDSETATNDVAIDVALDRERPSPAREKIIMYNATSYRTNVYLN